MEDSFDYLMILNPWLRWIRRLQFDVFLKSKVRHPVHGGSVSNGPSFMVVVFFDAAQKFFLQCWVADAEGTQKKSPLESLSKDELVNRCKNLLSIAQKAKHAKDEANKKVKTLEDQLNEIKLQNEEFVKQKGNSDCKKCLEMQKTEQKLQRQVTTMQEMLSMLTDQKLTFTMEMDKLKKQNEALKKQQNDNRLPDEEVKAKLEDLDIAVESYRRQNKRLAKENDDLIQQLDTMEAKLRTRESEPRLLNEPDQADGEDVSRDEVLEGEVKSLREEVERLNSENKKKNEQMKELYEKFNREKTELEEQLQSVSGAKNEIVALGTEISKLTEERTYFEKQLKESETLKENLNSIIAENDKLKFSNRNLSEQLQAVFEEKKEVLDGIESINQNNFELNKLVQSIASERDECLMNIEKVATEKIKLLKLLDTVNAEKTVIVQENVCLKADKEKLNENIKLVIAEKNSLEAHVKLIERHLQTLLNKSICFLEKSESKSLINNSVASNACVSEESKSFCIVSELRNSLNQVCTLAGGEISEEQLNCNQLESVDRSNTSMLDLKDNHSFINPDISVSFPTPTIQEQIINMEEVFRLHSELELLNTVITNLEMIGKNLEDENKSLKNALNLLNSQDGDVGLMSINVSENVEFRARTCDCGRMGSLKLEDEHLGAHALKLEEGLSVSSTATGEREQSTQYESNKLNTLETCDHQEKHEVENSNYKEDVQSLQRIIEEKTTEVEKIDKENKNLAEKHFENLKKLNELQFELSTTKKIDDERKLEIEALKAELCNTQTKFVATQENQTLVNTKQKDDITILQNTLEEQNTLIANSERKIQNLESEIAQCTLENNNYKDKILEFQILIEDKSNNSDNLKVLEELKLELENAYEGVRRKDSEMKSLKSELLTVETNLSQIHDKYNHQNTQVSSQAENIEMLKTTLENQNTEITSLKRELELNKEALEHFTTENNEYKQTMQNLQKLIEDKSTEEGKIYCDYERLDKEHAKTLQVLNELEVELANKKKQIDEANLEFRAEENISEMQAVSYTHSEIVYKQTSDINLLQKTVEDSTVQNTNLRRVMKSLCDKLAVKAIEALEVGKDYKDLNEKHDDTLRAMNEKQIEFDTILETIHKRDSEIESHKAELLNLQANVIEMKNVCDNQISTIENQNETIINLQKTLGDQARLLADSESEIKNKISEYEKEMNSKQVESETIRKTLIEKNSEIESLKTKLLNIQGTLSKIQDACDGHAATIFKQNNDIDILNKTLEDKSSLLTNSEIQIQALEDKLSQTVREDDGYKDQVVDLQKSHKEEVIEFENLFQKYQELNQKYSDTVKLLNDKHIELDNANETVKEINSEIESLRAELFISQQSLAEASEACSNHIESKHRFQEAIDKFKEKIKILECQQREMENHLMFTSERDGVLFNEIVKKHESLVAEQLELKKLLVVKESKLQEVSNELKCSKQSKEEVNSRLHELHTTVMSLRASHSALRGEVEVCRSRPFLSEETVRAVQEAVVGHAHAEVARAKLEVKELLGEMNEMNQALKQRGESVSLLKEMVAELEQKLADSSARLATAVESLAVKTTELEGKETQLQEVSEQLASQREELRRREEERSQGILRIEELERRILYLERECEDARKEGAGEAPSEVMSSSTTSKAEEMSRLKDLEGSFEERYTKLRTLAVKLKKKVGDLTVQLGQGETEKKKMIAERSELVAKISLMSDQAKSLQKSFDVLTNESAAAKLQLQEYSEEKERLCKELDVYAKDKQRLEASFKELRSQIQNMAKEKEADNITRKEMEIDLNRLGEEVKLAERKLSEEIERHQSTRELLEASKQECKKRSVLSLEMEDYEKSVSDLTQQLSAERATLKELEGHLETQREINKGLQDQVHMMEQRVLGEEARATEFKEQLSAARTRQADSDAVLSERNVTLAELIHQLEQQKEHCESLSLQLAELSAEKNKLFESSKARQDLLMGQVVSLEDQLTNLKYSLGKREGELSDLQEEFRQYKVRAQSVLRQKARGDESSSFSRDELLEETNELRKTADTLRTRLEETGSQLQSALQEQATLKEERTRALQRCQALSDSLSEAREENHRLQEQVSAAVSEQREALRSQKIQHDTLIHCYKQQLEELEGRLATETATLKGQLGAVEQLAHHSLEAPPVRRLSQHAQLWENRTSNTAEFTPVKMDLNMALSEREEGEGSESIDSTSPNLAISRERHQRLMPLDKLLASSLDDEDNNAPASTSPGAELSLTKEQLSDSERRIRHLSALLSEAEQDLAKLTQLNGVLKEEIRRQQRSVEREQHAQNFEYLKNVVLKFVTLQGGDERSRLVPVLNTILKLSPEESVQLNQVAKGIIVVLMRKVLQRDGALIYTCGQAHKRMYESEKVVINGGVNDSLAHSFTALVQKSLAHLFLFYAHERPITMTRPFRWSLVWAPFVTFSKRAPRLDANYNLT
uniref:GRIP domain-containing protein n=1 Tax=Timema douglasi TaxID=61478 RepID=A0A7R8VD87_TIMDO|nr:unnamed protein product [Timema douglasi]